MNKEMTSLKLGSEQNITGHLLSYNTNLSKGENNGLFLRRSLRNIVGELWKYEEEMYLLVH